MRNLKSNKKFTGYDLSHQWSITCTKSSFLKTVFCYTPHADHKRESKYWRSEGNPSQDKKNTISSGIPGICYRYQWDHGQDNGDSRYPSKDQEIGQIWKVKRRNLSDKTQEHLWSYLEVVAPKYSPIYGQIDLKRRCKKNSAHTAKDQNKSHLCPNTIPTFQNVLQALPKYKGNTKVRWVSNKLLTS